MAIKELRSGDGDLVVAILGLRAFSAALTRYENTEAKDIDWSDTMIQMVKEIEFEEVRQGTTLDKE